MSKVFTIAEGLENLGALKTGGQGSIYRAKRIGPIITAVKLLPTPILKEDMADKNYRDFHNEVEKLKKVNELPNPNVVRILNYGISETGSFPFIEMEFIEGPDLEDLLKAPHDPVFTVKETIRVAEHLANALAHCHRVDVKHGDIKSNNVKFNIHTGNYVLLDFGLAVMSDEQRRTSLRHAGAIEFMAPEQSDGSLLFQSDVYSYGVILYELLAGRVPFPLEHKSETARNHVLVAHIEQTPPELLPLRAEHIPESWPEDRKSHEMGVPQWLLDMIRKCLEKRPEDRFGNGIEVYEYILRNSTQIADSTDLAEMLRQENKRLKEENLLLQKQLTAAPAPVGAVAAEQPVFVEQHHASYAQPAYAPPAQQQGGAMRKAIPIGLAILAAIVALFLVLKPNNRNADSASTVVPIDTTTEEVSSTTTPVNSEPVPEPRENTAPAPVVDTVYQSEPVTRRSDTATRRRTAQEPPVSEEEQADDVQEPASTEQQEPIKPPASPRTADTSL